MVVCHSIVDLIMGALAEAVPERVMGDSCGCLYNYSMAIDPCSERRVMFGAVVPGGIAATVDADGIDVMDCHVTNCHIPPIEAIETESPVRYLRRELRENSGGAGRNRGDVGQLLTYRILGEDPQLHHTSPKSASLPQGTSGGLPGDGDRWMINEGTPEERRLACAIGEIEQLRQGDTVTHYTPGGGRYGPPKERDPERVRDDVEAGLVSINAAATIYGVRIDPVSCAIIGLDR